MNRIRSGTYEVVRGSAQPKQNALREVESALSDLSVCLELLGRLAGGDSERAVKEAQRAMERVEEWVGQRRLRAAPQAKPDARRAS